MSYTKQKGKNFEDRIAEKIHTELYSQITEYKELYETFNDPKLKPRRDASSGSSKDSDGDINLGLAYKFIPISLELKHWKTLDITLDSIIKGKIKALENIYWEQANQKTSDRLEKTIIVFKANRTEDFVFYVFDDFPNNNIGDNYVRIGQYVISSFNQFLQSRISIYLTENNS